MGVGRCVVGIMGFRDDGRLVRQLVIGPGGVYVGLVGIILGRLLVVGNYGLIHSLDLGLAELVECRSGRVLCSVIRIVG